MENRRNPWISSGLEARAAYCPVTRNTGLCGGGTPLVTGVALNGAVRSVTSVSSLLFWPVAMVLVVVLIIATTPPSHMLA